MRTTLLILILCAFGISLKAQLYIQNLTSERISVAIGCYNSKQLYETKGWFIVTPNSTLNTGILFSSTEGSFFFYAKGIEGNYLMLVGKNNKFFIKNAGDSLDNINQKYSLALFRKIDYQLNPNSDKKAYVLYLINPSDYKVNSGCMITKK